MIEDALRAFIRTGLSNQRVYSHQAPQPLPAPADDPYIVFYRITPSAVQTHHGPAPALEVRYQFSAYGRQHTPTITLSDRLRRLLNGYRGMMGTVYVHAIHLSGGSYGYNERTGRHHFSVDMQVRYKDSA